MTKFSIIVPHYDGSIQDNFFIRGIQSLIDQTYKDFEVLIYHDGPVSRPIPDIWKQLSNAKLIITDQRANDWGHTNRDRGIREAEGEYIIHFNPDNVLYNYALQIIANELDFTYRLAHVTKDIVIMPILMVGMATNGKFFWREDYDSRCIFTGIPAIKNNIDAMQLVMKKDLWIKEGGWSDKSEQSDGNMYPGLVNKYGARVCKFILGEHW